MVRGNIPAHKTRQVQEEISALVPIRQPLIIDMYLVQVEVAGTAVAKVSQIQELIM